MGASVGVWDSSCGSKGDEAAGGEWWMGGEVEIGEDEGRDVGGERSGGVGWIRGGAERCRDGEMVWEAVVVGVGKRGGRLSVGKRGGMKRRRCVG